VETRQPVSLLTICRRKANCIGYIWLSLLKDVIEGKKVEVTGRRGGKRQQLLDNLKEKRRYCKWKAEGLDNTLWRKRFGTSCGRALA